MLSCAGELTPKKHWPSPQLSGLPEKKEMGGTKAKGEEEGSNPEALSYTHALHAEHIRRQRCRRRRAPLQRYSEFSCLSFHLALPLVQAWFAVSFGVLLALCRRLPASSSSSLSRGGLIVDLGCERPLTVVTCPLLRGGGRKRCQAHIHILRARYTHSIARWLVCTEDRHCGGAGRLATSAAMPPRAALCSFTANTVPGYDEASTGLAEQTGPAAGVRDYVTQSEMMGKLWTVVV